MNKLQKKIIGRTVSLTWLEKLRMPGCWTFDRYEDIAWKTYLGRYPKYLICDYFELEHLFLGSDGSITPIFKYISTVN